MPKVNDIVIIKHKANGNGSYMGCKPIQRRVKRVYADGSILDDSGDKWSVRLGMDNKLYTTG